MVGRRVGIIGAGYIAQTHLEALAALPSVQVAAIVDPNVKAAERLAAQRSGVRVFADLATAIAEKAFDRAHVLVPPHLHAAVGEQLLSAGIATFMEKPLGVTAEETARLLAAADAGNARLGVNQNLIYHPALQTFCKDLEAGRYGRLRHVSASIAVPLRQLAGRQFGHWMFERPSNILLEQMVHPLSQVIHLIGRATITAAVARPAIELAPGMHFHKGFEVMLQGERAPAQLHMAFGENYPAWLVTVVCDDGAVVIDMFRNQITRLGRTPWLDAADTALVGVKAGFGLVGQGVRDFARYVGAQVRLARRSDVFFTGMRGSIAAFHEAVDVGDNPPIDGAFGGHLVGLCLDVARLAGVSDAPAPLPANVVAPDAPVPAYDVAVFGGTGFIGRVAVEKLVEAGYSVGVVARNLRGLAPVFRHEKVHLLRGDVTRVADVERGVGSAKYVVNLAHGGASGSRQQIVDAMVGSAELVARVCMEKGVARLLHVSSIAGLYLGEPGAVISPQTPPDPQGAERGDYSFAKAEAERRLLALHREKGLPVTIQRPGVVVGDGTSPFHSGLGLFNNDQYCLGWNDGRNGLPFVLVEDVATAVVAALKADDRVLGRTDNIVGGVYMSAREYLDILKGILGRPLVFRPQSVWLQVLIDRGKWLVKRVGGKQVPFPTPRDFASRGMPVRWDISETESVLGWSPNRDRETFIERGIRVPARALLD